MSETERDRALERENAGEAEQQVSIKLAPKVIAYFKEEASEVGIPYQILMNLYLINCVKEKKRLQIGWK